MARGNQLAVVAIGGNALVQGEGPASVAGQFRAARELTTPLRQLLERGWRLLVTHGNGPQVGFIWRRSELAAQIAPELPPLGLDVCGAQSQGGLGYLLASTLAGELRRAGRPEQVAAVITHTVVGCADPAFGNPTKPVGGFYTDQEAARLAQANGWDVAEDSGRGWRRVVPSPRPLRVVEEGALTALLAASFVVVAAGGGGIPVVEESGGGYRGVEAVIDKDRTAALLARVTGADLLVITTAVAQVAVDYGKPSEQFLDVLSAADARALLAAGQFPPGSMGPKMEAAIEFAEAGGETLITSPGRLGDALDGKTGTRIKRAGPPRQAA